MRNKTFLFFIILLIATITYGLAACSTSDSINRTTPAETTDNAASSALNNAENSSADKEPSKPDYETVFPDDMVNEIIITISPDQYENMLADMTEIYGEFGSGSNRNMVMNNGRGAAPFENKAEDAPAPDFNDENQPIPPIMEQNDVGQPEMNDRGGNAGMVMFESDENPIWVEATIEFNGETWEHVGIRYKGNSSLKSLWSSGTYKLPFKLDFDQFEDEYSETEDQRLYGFKQLSFSANFKDSSYLRERIAADIFRDAGVPSAQTAFYAVYIDTGDGPVYYGLYTAVEVVDDTVIETQFDDDSGNVYKPSGGAATFAEGSFNEEAFDKETNIDEADYSDVQALYNTLHADTRISDPSQWRSDLEDVFDVDGFLRWLATNTLIQNWDSYGNAPHNYYLYHDPTTDKLVWIPWDNNESLKSSSGKNSPLPFDLSSVNDTWPLISYLIEDEVYSLKYNQYLEEIATTIFYPERMASIYSQYHDLITDYVEMEQPGYTTLSNISLFTSSVEELINHTAERYNQVMTYLGTLE